MSENVLQIVADMRKWQAGCCARKKRLAAEGDMAAAHDARDDELMIEDFATRLSAAVQTLESENARLTAEVEALKRDAARYRWLRIHNNHRIADLFPSELNVHIDAAISMGGRCSARGGCRQSLDR